MKRVRLAAGVALLLLACVVLLSGEVSAPFPAAFTLAVVAGFLLATGRARG